MSNFSRRMMLLTAVSIVIPLIGQVKADSVAVRVAATSDDAEENLASGDMESLDSSDLELGLERVPDDGEGVQIAAMRFLNVGIQKTHCSNLQCVF